MQIKEIYLAGGCYWGVEKYISGIRGVLETEVGAPLAVECRPIERFWTAEEYHQKYLDKNPGGYCHVPLELIRWVKTVEPRICIE